MKLRFDKWENIIAAFSGAIDYPYNVFDVVGKLKYKRSLTF